MFAKPLHELTLTEAMTPRHPGHPASIRPAVIMGGGFLPGAITRRAALNATLSTIIHPGLAPPEPHYTPSKALADFARCRDLTCRFPGCRQPATTADIDHTIAWPYGPTCASNLKCLCRKHHLLKPYEEATAKRRHSPGTPFPTRSTSGCLVRRTARGGRRR
jgi:hypothetical protein